VLFLSIYGAKSALAIFNPKPLIYWGSDSTKPLETWKIVLTTLALTFLNPHVYLDTVVLVGGVAAQYDKTPRIYFTLGAILASCTWFYCLAFFSVKVASFFESKCGIRLLNGAVCTIMWMLASLLIKNEIA
jgi:L-lysine exporter family protein LysE/ArgO